MKNKRQEKNSEKNRENKELLKLFTCPVSDECTYPPIYQCGNGHVTCNKCLLRLLSCPVCRNSETLNRNLVMENIIEKLTVPCQNDGCEQQIKYSEKSHHDADYQYKLFKCKELLKKCLWEGLYSHYVDHLKNHHPSIQKAKTLSFLFIIVIIIN